MSMPTVILVLAEEVLRQRHAARRALRILPRASGPREHPESRPSRACVRGYSGVDAGGDRQRRSLHAAARRRRAGRAGPSEVIAAPLLQDCAGWIPRGRTRPARVLDPEARAAAQYRAAARLVPQAINHRERQVPPSGPSVVMGGRACHPPGNCQVGSSGRRGGRPGAAGTLVGGSDLDGYHRAGFDETRCQDADADVAP